MSDASEKSFDAPPSRIAKAKREGNVPRAQEFGANLAFAAAAIAAIAVSGRVGDLASSAIRRAAAGNVPAGDAGLMLLYALAPLCAAMVAGAFGGMAQSGGLIVTSPSMNIARLHPFEGLKRMLSRDSVTHAARALGAFAISTGAMLPALRELVRAASAGMSTPAIANIAWRGAMRVIFSAVAVGMLFAIAEYAVARRAWLRKLRMSLAELKRELKESDGDPVARGRRRSLHRALARGAIARVKDAAFVVVNPTHVAIALEYRPPAVPVPAVLVRAAGEAAIRARRVAAAHGIPVVEDVQLARALYRDTRTGEPIPHEYYVAVAEVVVALYRRGALRA
jgi:flagellar biosynthesis protein FlhB